MNNITLSISSVILELVQKKFNGDYSNVKEIKLFWHNYSYLMFSYANLKKLNRKAKALTLNDLCDLNIIPSTLLQFEKENKLLISTQLDRCVNLIVSNNCNLSLLREFLLNEELRITKSSICVKHGKVSRDVTGSYYTPKELAQAIVQKSFDDSFSELISQNAIHDIRIADLSCGSGEFLWATQEYLKTHYQISYEDSAILLWGFDVDPIALQITLCELLSRAKQSNWSDIISHFLVANPLVSTQAEGSFDRKNELFALNRIYAAEMGINFSTHNSIKDFDIILGNPPWEKIRFEERKFFSCYEPQISELSKKDDREKAINDLKTEWNELYCWTKEISADYSIMCSGKFVHPHINKSVAGELNTYALFTELSYSLLNNSGFTTLIVKSTLATTPAHKNLWSSLLLNGAIKSLLFFENKKKIFNIDSRERFAVISLTKSNNESFDFSAGLETVSDLRKCSVIPITSSMVLSINPFTNMLPNVTSIESIKVLIDAHQKMPLFEHVYPDCHFGRLIHLTAHADQITTTLSDDVVPIYEGKFLEQYDARYSTFAGLAKERKYAPKASAVKNVEKCGYKPFPESRYFVRKELWAKYTGQYNQDFSLCWRSLTSPTNARTMIAMILPTCPTCQSIKILQIESDKNLLMLLGLFNSLPFDYFVRLKMPGIDLTQSVIKQIPVPNPSAYEEKCLYYGKNETLESHILSSIHHLIKSEEILMPLAERTQTLTYQIDDSLSKDEIKKNLDNMFARAYQIGDSDFSQIITTFPKYL